MKKSAFLFLLFILPLAQSSAQELSMKFNGETLSEALRRIDQAQNDKRILFLFDELEIFTVTTVIEKLSAEDAVRKVCSPYPVSVTEFGDNLFVEYVPTTIHLATVEVNGEASPSTEYRQDPTSNIPYRDSALCVQRINVLEEEMRRHAQGRKSISVSTLLNEMEQLVSEDYSEETYDPHHPTHERFYTEEDYGSIDASIQRLDQHRMSNNQPTASHIVHRTSLSGRPVRWSIRVPKGFPAKIYDRDITFTKDIDIKYVKFIYIFDYNPTVRPYAVVLVELRNADEIREEKPWLRKRLFHRR